MTIWKLITVSNDLGQFVASNPDDIRNEVFYASGKPKNWATRPEISIFVEKRRKKAKPLGDISFIMSGSVVLNQKAYDVLREFLGQFGEFLELDCKNETFYFFNVLNLIPCIDTANSTYAGRSIIREAFLPDAVPKDAQVFKDPHKIETVIYVSDAAKQILDNLITKAELTGARFEAIPH